ncbi:MAG: hypothetical protein RR919_09200 [Bacteroidales bacterium]
MKNYLLIITLISLTSCTKFVWEDRSECPCILTLDLSNVDKNVSELHLWIFGEDNSILSRDTIAPDRFGGTYDVLIKREMVKYYVWGNIKGATKLQDNLTLNSTLTKVENSSADSLYHYSKQLSTNFESQIDTVYLNKEFITLYFYLDGKPEIVGSEIIIEITSSGGYYLDGSIINSASNVQSTITPAENYCSIRLTRQKIEDMYLLLYSQTDTQKVLIDKYCLGTLLKQNKYDMHSILLQDIIIEIDFSNTFINLLLTT